MSFFFVENFFRQKSSLVQSFFDSTDFRLKKPVSLAGPLWSNDHWNKISAYFRLHTRRKLTNQCKKIRITEKERTNCDRKLSNKSTKSYSLSSSNHSSFNGLPIVTPRDKNESNLEVSTFASTSSDAKQGQLSSLAIGPIRPGIPQRIAPDSINCAKSNEQ